MVGELLGFLSDHIKGMGKVSRYEAFWGRTQTTGPAVNTCHGFDALEARSICFSHSRLIIESVYPNSEHSYCHPGVGKMIHCFAGSWLAR